MASGLPTGPGGRSGGSPTDHAAGRLRAVRIETAATSENWQGAGDLEVLTKHEAKIRCSTPAGQMSSRLPCWGYSSGSEQSRQASEYPTTRARYGPRWRCTN